MKDSQTFETAAQLLAAKGIGAGKSILPLFRVVSKLFFGGRPPQFRRFWPNLLSFGVFFTLASGTVRWFLVWSPERLPIKGFVVITLAVGVASAIFGAVFMEYLKRKYNLPNWEDLKRDSADR